MSKKIMAMIMAFAIVISSITYTPQVAKAAVNSGNGNGSWKLVWSDEFDQAVGGGVDTSTWNYDIGNGDWGWGNAELQYYTNSTNNVSIQNVDGATDGKALMIKAQREGGQITSGRITSLGKFEARYGRMEARIKMVNGMQNGVWPAFWMMGHDINQVGWPNCGEIDIMEHRSKEQNIISTLHWNPNPNNNPYGETFYGSELNGQFGHVNSMDDWHTFRCDWYENEIQFFLDGQWYETLAISDANMEEFRKSHYFLLNLATGSTQSPFTQGITVDDNWQSSTMYVDYVRVYQGTDGAFQRSKTNRDGGGDEPITVNDGYTACAADVKTNVGQWNYLVCQNWVGAAARYKGGENLNDFALKVTGGNGAEEWGLQAFTNELQVTAGHTYQYSITMNSDTAGAPVLLKDELAEDSNLGTKTLTKGDNVFSGTYTPGSGKMQFMFALGKVATGTTLHITNVTLTDVTQGGEEQKPTEEPKPTEKPTQSGNTDWTTVDNSNNVFAYANANNMNVVNVQRPGWASEDGIYMHTSVGVGYITINGKKVGTESAAIDGAGAVVYLSALNAQISKVCYYSADGTLIASIDIKNTNASGGGETQPEETTPEVTTPPETESHDPNKDPSDITRIYVTTDEPNPTITKPVKTPGTITVISGEDAINGVQDITGTIKLRGNSTSLADKPAYNISFDSKQELVKGAAKGKKWCLLANAFDKTLLRNKLAMDLGKDLGGVATPLEHYADLYINGKLMGTYLISEPAENGRSGIDYDENSDDELLFELEADRDESADGVVYHTTGLGVRFATEDFEASNTTKYNNWVNTLTTFENALKQTSSDKVFDYIDVDSFVDMYIVNELFKTVDFGYSSVKFYTKKDANGTPIIHAGSLWDFDLSSGNSSQAECRTTDGFRGQTINTWFGYLMKNNTFKNKVIAKYKSMQARIQNIYQENKLGISQIDQNLAYMGKSKDRNYSPISEGGAGWSESQPDSAEYKYYPYGYNTLSPYINYTYDQHVEFLKNWLQKRNEWLCTQWGIDYTKVDEVIKVSDDIHVTGYQMTSSLDGIDGSMGFRVVYQAEPTIEGQKATEVGLVYGLVYGDNPITASDVVYDSDSEYVKSYKATEAGKLDTVMGDSKTASYYVRTMSCALADQPNNVSTTAYTTKYYVRAYAKLSDGSIVYSNATSYTVYDIADYIYQNQLVSNYRTYEHLYNKVLKYVNSSYKEGEYSWGSIIVK